MDQRSLEPKRKKIRLQFKLPCALCKLYKNTYAFSSSVIGFRGLESFILISVLSKRQPHSESIAPIIRYECTNEETRAKAFHSTETKIGVTNTLMSQKLPLILFLF